MGKICKFETKDEKIKRKIDAYEEYQEEVDGMLADIENGERDPDKLIAAFEGICKSEDNFNEYLTEIGKPPKKNPLEVVEEVIAKNFSEKELNSGLTTCKEIDLNGTKVKWPPKT